MFVLNQLLIVCVIAFVYYNKLHVHCDTTDDFEIVKTDSGEVRGKKLLTLFDNKPYYAFKGIPYARPPIADLRFKPPKKPIAWNGVKDTLEFGNECTQPKDVLRFGSIEEYVVGDEDCLFLNVYTPDVTGNFPVMFFIHGGAFSEGSGNIYGPDFIINQNEVVLVTINYRLGSLGFASFDTSEYSGNMGLKDQLFALKWVNRNIENFGGNKDMVTIFGESAGAASTHYHTITQQNSNLFKRSIIMSGSIKSGWARRSHNEHTSHMVEIARRIGYSVANKDDLLNIVNKIDAQKLIEHTAVPLYNAGLPRKTITLYNYVPVVENISANEPYLIEDINEMIANEFYKSTIDTMFGFTSMEAIFIVNEEMRDECLLKSFNKKFEFQLPLDHDIDIQYNSEEYRKISKEVHDFYFGDGGLVNMDTMLQYIDLQSAIWFTYPLDVSVKQQAIKSTGKTFYYVFSVEDENNFVRKALNVTLPGASHFDEMCYLFRCNIGIPNFYEKSIENSTARKTIENITKLWVNFAKYGDPSIPNENLIIKPIQHNDINYFNVSNTGIEIGKNPRNDMMEFWDNIYKNHENKYKKSTLKMDKD